MKLPTLPTLLFVLIFASNATAGDQADVTLYFSPRGGCEAVIIAEIDNASEEILIAMYSFSSKPISAALYKARIRGVKVSILLDRRQPTAHYSMANDFLSNNLNVRIDRKHTMMHAKTMIIDNHLVIGGSYNYSKLAEHRNVEILTLIESPSVASKVKKNWSEHWAHADLHDPFYTKKIPSTKTVSTQPCKSSTCPTSPIPTSSRPRFKRRQ